MALWSVGMKSGLLRAGEVGRMDVGLASRSTIMRELCGVGLGRAYSHEMWFAIRLVEQEVDRFVLTLRKHFPPKEQKSFDTNGRFSYSAAKSSLHTSLERMFTLSAHAGTARSSARLLFGYQSSPGPFAFP